MQKQILITLPISIETIHNAIVGAFEGASTYWIDEANPIAITPHTRPNFVWWGEASVFENDFSFEIVYDDPDKEEGNGEGRKIIDRESITTGLCVMAVKQPRHFMDLFCELDDALTHDVFLQCVVLGDAFYG